MRRDELLHYYERELRFVRRMGAEFAEKYPEVAGRLLLEPTKCADPHVERLIEAVAMMTARVHMRLDDDLADVSDSLLGVLYPHYLSPVPSMTVARFEVDPTSAPPGGLTIERHTPIETTHKVQDERCVFRTAYPLTLFPIDVVETRVVSATELGAPVPDGVHAALRIKLRSQPKAKPIDKLGIDHLRFFLDAVSGDIHRLYEAFLRDPRGLWVRASEEAAPFALPAKSIREVGFGHDEGLLEYPRESFLGYRLLQEYFTYPDKFLFVDLFDLGSATSTISGSEFIVDVLLGESLGQIEWSVVPENLKLGCTPIINLFPKSADPISVTQTSVDYPVVPDERAPYSFEVHSVRSVESSSPGSGRLNYRPLYGLNYGESADQGDAFWHARRRPSVRKGDSGSEVTLSIVDGSLDTADLGGEKLHVETLCTNRQLPARLPFGDPSGDFQIEKRPAVLRITALRKPSEPLPPPIGGAARWRLVSHLSLNHLSLGMQSPGAAQRREQSEALAALREILRLYDFEDSPVTRQRIEGLVAMHTSASVHRVRGPGGGGFARGVAIDLEFDPARYTGSGVFLFASVLERFFALYGSINSFTRTTARERGASVPLKVWEPRSGTRDTL